MFLFSLKQSFRNYNLNKNRNYHLYQRIRRQSVCKSLNISEQVIQVEAIGSVHIITIIVIDTWGFGPICVPSVNNSAAVKSLYCKYQHSAPCSSPSLNIKFLTERTLHVNLNSQIGNIQLLIISFL